MHCNGPNIIRVSIKAVHLLKSIVVVNTNATIIAAYNNPISSLNKLDTTN